MIDRRLDQRLVDLNHRYQQIAKELESQRSNRFRKYFCYLKKLDFISIINDLSYRRHVKKKQSVAGNICEKVNENQSIEGTRIAVYSCIVGAYDNIIEPVYVEPGVRYFMFTDQTIPDDSAWEKIDIKTMDEYKSLPHPTFNRKIKVLQNEMLKDFDYTVYVDGNIEIVAGVSPLIEEMGNCDFGVHFHPKRDCIYDEAIAVKHLRRKFRGDMDSQLESYKSEGFPAHFGLYENSILIRDNRSKSTSVLMKQWWEEYCKYPTRDQLSLPYVLWKNNYDRKRIMIMGDNLEQNPRFNRIQDHIQ